MKAIKKFPAWFARQRLSGRIFLIVLGLLIIAFIVSIFSVIFARPEQQSLAITVTPRGTDIVVASTWTSTPTNLPSSSGASNSTRTPLPTGLPTQSLDTATAVIIPPTLAFVKSNVLILISAVNKELEYVDIQNAGLSSVVLIGWTLVSETGNQVCQLKGTLKPKEVLRIWAGKGQVGISCGFHNPIWLDQESDPAVLYNAKGEEVSRYP